MSEVNQRFQRSNWISPTFRKPDWVLILYGVAVFTPLLLALWHDISRPFNTTPDADIIFIGQFLRLSEGLPQTYFDHPAHTYLVLGEWWLKAWSCLGLIPELGQSNAIQSPNVDGYFQAIIVPTRLFSASLAMIFIGVMIAALRVIEVPPWLSGVLGLVFALSQGVAEHALILRAELLSATGVLGVFVCLCAAARVANWKRVRYMFFAGVLCLIAMESKVQAVIPLLGVSLLVIAFGRDEHGKYPFSWDWRSTSWLLFGLSLILPVLYVSGFSMFELERLVDNFRFTGVHTGYQFLVLGWIIGLTALYTAIYGIPWRDTVRSLLGLFVGMAVGIYLAFINFNPTTIDVVVNFYEHLNVFVNQGDDSWLEKLQEMVFLFLRRRATDWYNPIVVAEVILCFVALRFTYIGERRRALQIVFLVGLAWCCETVFGMRYYSNNYKVYVEIWVFVAIGVALAPLSYDQYRGILACGSLVFIVWCGAFVLPHRFIPKQENNTCFHTTHYLVPSLANKFEHHCLEENRRKASP